MLLSPCFYGRLPGKLSGGALAVALVLGCGAPKGGGVAGGGAAGGAGLSGAAGGAAAGGGSGGGASGAGGAPAVDASAGGAGGAVVPEAGAQAGATGLDAAPDVPATVDAAADDSGVGAAGEGDFMIGPTYAVAPELTVNAGAAHGLVQAFTIASTESPIFPGVTGPYTRQGWIYTPPGYVKGTALPFIIAQDGRDYMARLPKILDNMIPAKRVPPMIALMIMAGPGDGPGSERGFEYDTVSEAFTTWVETCVLPKMTKSFGVAFTTNPDGRASMGGSSGGAAAFTMAWFHPELYRRVLSFSGTFTAQGPTTTYPQGAWAYPDHLIADTAAKPIRVWMEVAEHDAGANNTLASMKNWILANQKVAAALKARGYHYQFNLALGAMHNDPKVWDATLPSALEWLWRGYPVN